MGDRAAEEEAEPHGIKSLPGKPGVASTALSPEGDVRVEGITWRARSVSGEIKAGEHVRVKPSTSSPSWWRRQRGRLPAPRGPEHRSGPRRLQNAYMGHVCREIGILSFDKLRRSGRRGADRPHNPGDPSEWGTRPEGVGASSYPEPRQVQGVEGTRHHLRRPVHQQDTLHHLYTAADGLLQDGADVHQG